MNQQAFKSGIEIIDIVLAQDENMGEVQLVFFKLNGADFTHLSYFNDAGEPYHMALAHGLMTKNLLTFPVKTCPICEHQFKTKEECHGFNEKMHEWLYDVIIESVQQAN